MKFLTNCKVWLQEWTKQICDHIFGGIAGFAFLEELTDCHQIIAGGDDRLFHIAVLADLREAGGCCQVVAQAGTVDSVFDDAAFFDIHIHRFRGAAIADRAVFPFVKVTQKAKVANSIAHAISFRDRKVCLPIGQL